MDIRVGMKDKNGHLITDVGIDGWYKTDDGAIRDRDGYEWFGDEGSVTDQKGIANLDKNVEIQRDDLSGEKIVVRDFKIMLAPGTKIEDIDRAAFIAFHKKTIEDTMVETGWDYADENSMQFGELKDGHVHILVKMRKKNWGNRANAYAGAKQGQKGKVRSKALQKAGAVDTNIYGVIEQDKRGADIVAGRDITGGKI